MDPVLSAIDTDHDGILSATEIAAAPTALKPSIKMAMVNFPQQNFVLSR